MGGSVTLLIPTKMGLFHTLLKHICGVCNSAVPGCFGGREEVMVETTPLVMGGKDG
jgi:hypothetical protein